MAAERGGCSLEAVPLPPEVRESLAELELELSEEFPTFLCFPVYQVSREEYGDIPSASLVKEPLFRGSEDVVAG